MNSTDLLRETLLEEMGRGIKSMEGLLRKVEDKDWNYKPNEKMRSLKELANHIIAIPEVDLEIWKEKSHEEIQRLELAYERLENVDQMIEAMNKGFQLYKTYMLSLSEVDFLSKKTKPFYLEEGQVQAHWLIEDVSHIFHHRGQFFNYLKQLDYDVSMNDLYV
ncbi:DinB family protein [Alkalihalobacillus trypoxylicola]|uniref:Damage-inducible protein DinB n=1 Tax=Alkalihalobacillus trypoxylicola TaxID=519424 RepID=A0A161PDK8_9BACI|nr:DinB family protein [Alkalihalobacillus trypoxylicola]KYG26048.1 damage-inducible protein DinB [Alkalihalobacillus trypoxylicola]